MELAAARLKNELGERLPAHFVEQYTRAAEAAVPSEQEGHGCRPGAYLDSMDSHRNASCAAAQLSRRRESVAITSASEVAAPHSSSRPCSLARARSPRGSPRPPPRRRPCRQLQAEGYAADPSLSPSTHRSRVAAEMVDEQEQGSEGAFWLDRTRSGVIWTRLNAH